MTEADNSCNTDQELVRLALAGSSRALEELWRRYQQRLFLFIRRRVGLQQDAEDLLQESFIKARRYLDRYDGRYRFSTWLYTLSNQLIISHFRRRKTETMPADLPGQEAGPAELAESDSLSDTIWKAAAGLPEKQFSIVWLRYVEDMSLREAARVMKVSEINARVLLCRARIALVRICSPAGVGQADLPRERTGPLRELDHESM